MRHTSNPAQAAQRLAESLGYRVESRDRKWVLSGRGRTWPPMRGEEVLARLIQLARYDQCLTYPEMQKRCRWDPGWAMDRERSTIKMVPKIRTRTWCYGPLARLAKASSRKPNTGDER